MNRFYRGFMIRIIFLLFLCTIISPTSVIGEFYKYIDENGNVLFTDDIGKVPEAQRSKTENYNYRNSAPNESDYFSESQTSFDANESNYSSESETSSEADEVLENYKEFLKEKYGAKETCPDETDSEIQQAIETTWSHFTQAMIAGDLEEAFTYIAIFHQDEIRRKIEDLGKKELKDIYSSFERVQIETLYKDDGVAECGAIREEKTGTYSYPMRFIRDIDCVWRIQGF